MGKPPAPEKSADAAPPDANQEDILYGEIERQVGPLLPHNQRGPIVQRLVAIMMSEKFSGPIAHPKHFREYEQILPGSAERILSMAEREQNHNIAMEEKIIDAQVEDQKRGMRFGLAALVAIIVLGFAAGMMGNNTLAGMLLGAGVLGSIGAFIKGRFSEEKP